MDLIHQIFDAVWIREICLNFSQFVAVEWFLRFGCFLFGKTNFILKKGLLVLFNTVRSWAEKN